MLIDTHCHLTCPELASRAADVIAKAAQAGVGRILLVTIDLPDAEAALPMLERHRQLFWIAAIHPHEAGRTDREDIARLEALLRGEGQAGEFKDRIVAVGEIGLDFHYDFAPRSRQEQVFRWQLELAEKLNLPVVIHARESELRVCDILKEHPRLTGRVVFHCFSGDRSIARRVLDQGGWLSFTGVVTFPTAERIQESARYAPADRILLETDAPYLSPVPMRKVRPNEPALLVHTARFLADLRREEYTRLETTTTANAVRFFGLPEV